MSQQAVSNDGAQARYQSSEEMAKGYAAAEKASAEKSGVRTFVNDNSKIRVVGDRVEMLGGSVSSQDAPVDKDIFSTGRNQLYGSAVAHSDLKPNDLLTIGSKTDLVSAWLSAGLIEKGKDGLYHEIAAAKPETKAAPDYERSRLSNEHETILEGYVAQAGETQVLGVIEASISNADLTPRVAEIARQTGMEPAVVQAKMNSMIVEYVKLGQKVTNLDPQDYAAFCDWAVKNHGSAWKEAAWGLASREDARGLQALSQEYKSSGLQYDDAQLLGTDVGDSGYKIYREGKRILVKLPSGETLEARMAIKLGKLPLEVVK